MRLYYIVILSLFSPLVAAPTTPLQPSALLILFLRPITPNGRHDHISYTTQTNHLSLKDSFRYFSYRGIYATYAGFVTHSDVNGQITFPRKNLTDDLTLVITPRLQPLVIHGSTVQKMFVREGFPAAYYHLQRMYDPSLQASSWTITPLPAPDDHAIPGLALVILADPEHIVVPTEPIVTTPGATLYLPPLYVKDTIDTAAPALSFVKVSRYFSLINTAYQIGDDRYASVIVP